MTIIYFGCVSMFHLFEIIAIHHTNLLQSETRKTMIIPNHVDNIIPVAERMLERGLVDDLIVLNTLSNQEEVIRRQASQIPFSKEDTLFFSGLCMPSLVLFDLFPSDGKIIIYDDGTATCDVKLWEKQMADDDCFKRCFDYGKFSEIWLVSMVMNNNDSLPQTTIEIPLANLFSDKVKLPLFLEDLKYYFDNNDTDCYFPDILLFDRYFGAMDFLTEEEERFLFEQCYHACVGYDFEVKLHPGDNETKKCEGMPFKPYKTSGVPWEVLMCFDYARNGGKITAKTKIFLAYHTTSAVNQLRLFHDENCYYISLERLYNSYMLLDVTKTSHDVTDVLERCKECFPGRFFLPESFSELTELIRRLLPRDGLPPVETVKQMLLERELDFTRNLMLSGLKMLPSTKNVSTLYFDRGDGLQTSEVISIKLDFNETENFLLVFNVPEECRNATNLMWYAVRGVIAHIRLDSVELISSDGSVEKVDMNLVSSEGVTDSQGYVLPLWFDPFFHIEIKEIKYLYQVRFSGSWRFKIGHKQMLEAAGRQARNLSTRLESSMINERKTTEENVMLSTKLNDEHTKSELMSTMLNEARTENRRLTGEMHASVEYIGVLESEKTMCEKAMGELAGQNTSLRNLLDSTNQVNVNLAQEISDMRNSLSWKAMEPARKLKQLLNGKSEQ